MPTVIRQRSVGLFDAVGSVGGVVAPFIALNYGSNGMMGVGLICMLVVHLVWFVPSTLNVPIPDTFEDALKMKPSFTRHKQKLNSRSDSEVKLSFID